MVKKASRKKAAEPKKASRKPTARKVSKVSEKQSDNLALASLICGILCFFFPLLNIIAIVLGVIALNNIKKNPKLEGKNYAIAGIVLGSLSVVIGLIILLFVFSILGVVLSAIAAGTA